MATYKSLDEKKNLLDRIVCCLFAIGFIFGFLQAQPYNELGTPNMKNYAPKEYKGHSDVFGITQDTNGIIYFTGNSITEYDGEAWRQIPPLGVSTWAIILGNDKRVYVGSTNDFGYLQPDSIGEQQFISLLSYLPENQRNIGQIRQVHAVGDAIYFSSRSSGYLIRYNYKEKKVKVWRNKNKISILGSINGELYLEIAGNGLHKLIDDKIKLLAENSKFSNSSLIAVLPYKGQQLLICTRDKGLLIYHNSKVFSLKTEADKFLTTRIYFAKLLPNNNFLFSIIGKGVIVLDKTGKWIQHLDKSKGLPHDIVLSAHINSSKELLLGTYNGFSKVDILSATSKFRVDDKGLSINLNDIIRLDGNLYGASANSNGFVYLDKKEAIFRSLKNVPSGQFFNFFKSKSDLFGTGDGGMYQINKLQITPIYKGKKANFFAFTAHQSQLDSNRFFLGLRDGLISIYKKNNVWLFEQKYKMIPNNVSVRRLFEYPVGNLWMETQNQGFWLMQYNANNSNPITVKKVQHLEKGINNLNLGFSNLYSIDNKVSFTGTGGIFKYDEKKEQLVIDERFILPFPNLDIQYVVLARDSLGKIYAYFTKFDETNLLGVYHKQSDSTYTFESEIFRQIPQDDILNVTNLYPDANGILWIGDQSSLIRFDTKIKPSTNIISTKIRQVYLDSDSLIFAGHGNPSKPTLSITQNNINFHYLAPTINITGKNQYQTKLEGFDKKWSDWTEKTEKAYTNLHEGIYTFKAKGKTPAGELTKEASYSFTVLPPWWRTWWVYLVYVFLGGLSLYLFGQWRNRQLLERSKKLELIIQERTVEIEQLFQEAQAARAAAEEANEAKGTFLSTVSHELRTPLTSVIGFAKIIKKRLDERIFPFVQSEEKKTQRAIKQVSQNLDVVVSEGERLTTLINDVLDLAKIEAGRLDWNMAAISIEPVIQQSVAATSALFEQKSLPLQLELAENLPSINGDKDRLIQVVINLISNAVKFTDEGSILIQATKQDHAILVKVKDSGIGISQEDLPKVFEKFKQVGDTLTDKPKGTGLGLPICKEIIEHHQGKIWAESEISKGSSFLFQIPVIDT